MVDGSPYAPPQSLAVEQDGSQVIRYHKYVMHEPRIEWPRRCYRCNQRADCSQKVKLTYLNSWFYIFLLSPPILLLLALIFQKRFVVYLSLWAQYKKRDVSFCRFNGRWHWQKSRSIFAGGYDVNYIVAILAIAGRMVYIAKYRQGKLWITGAGKVFVASLPPVTP